MFHLALAAARRAQVRKRGGDFPPLLARNGDGGKIEDLAPLACLRQNEQPRRLPDQPAQGVVRPSQHAAAAASMSATSGSGSAGSARRPDSPSDGPGPRDRACPCRYSAWLDLPGGSAFNKFARKAFDSRFQLRGAEQHSDQLHRHVDHLAHRLAHGGQRVGRPAKPWRCRRSRRPTDRRECRVRTPGAPHP